MMCTPLLALSLLAYTGHAYRAQLTSTADDAAPVLNVLAKLTHPLSTRQAEELAGLQKLSALFLAFNPADGWQVPGAGLGPAAHNRRSSTSRSHLRSSGVAPNLDVSKPRRPMRFGDFSMQLENGEDSAEEPPKEIEVEATVEDTAEEPPEDTSAKAAVEDAAEDPPKDIDVKASSEPEPLAEPEPEEKAESEESPAKEELKSTIADGLGGSKPDKAVIAEILLKLEGHNPTASPAESPLINGKWKFLYASGVSPALRGLQLLLRSSALAPKSPSGADIVDVAETYLTISSDQPRGMSEVKFRVLSLESTIRLASNLEALSPVRIQETYDTANVEFMDTKVPLPSLQEFKRSILITYLDDDLMVVRDANGRPDVLVRAD
mmetsp:Transcript_28019/g.50789  ORF Transcript_28019/g.50789 Transcript_28019/m.50789 type:complete len:379 (+) Transcript_28019:19-1155(+)